MRLGYWGSEILVLVGSGLDKKETTVREELREIEVEKREKVDNLEGGIHYS